MRCDMFFEKKKPYPERSYPIEQIPSTVPNEYQSAQIERKFGMFIHFGINTFNNTEWSNGKLPVDSYRPSAIDAIRKSLRMTAFAFGTPTLRSIP